MMNGTDFWLDVVCPSAKIWGRTIQSSDIAITIAQ